MRACMFITVLLLLYPLESLGESNGIWGWKNIGEDGYDASYCTRDNKQLFVTPVLFKIAELISFRDLLRIYYTCKLESRISQHAALAMPDPHAGASPGGQMCTNFKRIWNCTLNVF